MTWFLWCLVGLGVFMVLTAAESFLRGWQREQRRSGRPYDPYRRDR